MKQKRIARLLVPALGLYLAACMHETPVDEAEAGKPARPAIAARMPIGSTDPNITYISTLAQLRAMGTSGNYKLANDIDASATATTPFVPIGGTYNPFHGTFDGGTFTISNLKIVGTGTNTGLFSWAANADLKNIRLANVNVTGGANTGAIAGSVQNVDLKDSYVTGTVTGSLNDQSKLGMFFGSSAYFTHVERCYATGTVTGWGKYVGGIIGYAAAYGTYDPNDDFRLLVREVFTNVTVNPSMPSGSSAVYAGGLIGYLVGGDIQEVNVVGSVTGRTSAGGILGRVVNDAPNSQASILRHAISRGVVTDAATAQRAGTVGTSTGTFGRCTSLWDSNTDTGTLNPDMPEPECQQGLHSDTLKKAQTTSPKHLRPYIDGMFLTQADINELGFPQCMLGSGSDGDWGFGTCGQTVIWHANSSTEYNTLARIPNPSVQPK